MKYTLLLILALPAYAQAIRVSLLSPVVSGSSVSVPTSTQNYFPDDGAEIEWQLSTNSLFDPVTSGRTPNLVINFHSLADDIYWLRARIIHAGTPNEWSNQVTFEVRTRTIRQAPSLEIVTTSPVNSDSMDVVFTQILDPELISYTLTTAANPSFTQFKREENIASNQTHYSTDVTRFKGAGTIYVKVAGYFQDGPGPESPIRAITYNRTDSLVYVIPHVARQDHFETWLTLSVPAFQAGTRIEAYVTYLDAPLFPGDAELTEVPFDLRPGEYYSIDISELEGSPLTLFSNVPLGISVTYTDKADALSGTLQVPAFKSSSRLTLTGLLQTEQAFSGFVISNTGDRDTSVTWTLRADYDGVNLGTRQGSFVVSRHENKQALIEEFWTGNTDAQITITFTGSDISVLGATFYVSECGGYTPSYFYGVELLEVNE